MLPPCTFGDPIIDYLNDPKVKKALHIPSNALEWDLCSQWVNLNYERNVSGSVWVY